MIQMRITTSKGSAFNKVEFLSRIARLETAMKLHLEEWRKTMADPALEAYRAAQSEYQSAWSEWRRAEEIREFGRVLPDIQGYGVNSR